ncbi:YigZ family protein [Metamycoplasma hyosynoviae]|uniref:YigZ family protein n=1 Tax=Metamycoplasma hyosynoviae TaxID=29559 RepID=UPI0023589FFB|nr:YigZ family protein [Metamycoplasma hyosynoviae]MDC8901040.1 YigZ family protein [Metamycoplasma hyosynoviae]MDC8912612.1 YigZ family protein [Metamycoplasma hyosynoviae]MDC8913232.1 YigZ family protein [Metamycoplasma hyosynoviae]MDC8914924.1 YigZ family protein [Metamycoplasma hyosynoviae]
MKILEIKKSKFISYSFTLNSKEEFKQKHAFLKEEHKKAKHIVYAYIIEDNKTKITGYSDDKEPRGVAGLPLYKLLENKNLTNKVIFVVRYFGGIELGKSNLLRAYLKCAEEELNFID